MKLNFAKLRPKKPLKSISFRCSFWLFCLVVSECFWAVCEIEFLPSKGRERAHLNDKRAENSLAHKRRQWLCLIIAIFKGYLLYPFHLTTDFVWAAFCGRRSFFWLANQKNERRQQRTGKIETGKEE